MNIYKKGEIVWAKNNKSKYYPAQIKYIYYKHKFDSLSNFTYEDKLTFYVEFFGSHLKQEITYNDITKFYDLINNLSDTKDTKFIKAVNEAKNQFIRSNKYITTNELFGILGKKRIRELSKKKLKNIQKTKNKSIDKTNNLFISNNINKYDLSDKDNISLNSLHQNNNKNEDDLVYNLKINDLIEALLKCKGKVRKKEVFSTAIESIEELSDIFKSNSKIENFIKVYILYYNI